MSRQMALSSVVVSDLTFIPTYIPSINPTRPGFSLSLPPFYIPCRRAQLLLLRSLFGLTFFFGSKLLLVRSRASPIRPSVRRSNLNTSQSNQHGGFLPGGGRGLQVPSNRARACPSGITSGTDEGRSPRNTREVTVAADHCEQSTEAPSPCPPWKKALRQTYTEEHTETRVVQQTNA